MQKKYEVKSLARAIDIIEAIGRAGQDGIGISDIARAAGTTKSNAFGIARTLCDRGFLSDTGEGMTRRYRLGSSFLRLASAATAQRPLAGLARQILRQLSAATGMTARFAILDRGYPIELVRESAGNGVQVSAHFAPYLGSRELPHTSAVGKSLLSTLADDEVRRIVSEIGMERRTAKSIGDVGALLADLALSRTRGFALDDEEDMDGVFCAAAPIRDNSGQPVGAISVSGLKLDRTRDEIEETGRIVRQHAAAMSAELGHRVG